ncbi:MAG: ATP-binding protein [Pseudomonadota bacterium]
MIGRRSKGRERSFGLTGRLSIIIVTVVILLCAAGAVFYLYSQAEARRDIAAAMADRIFSVVELVDDTPAEQRPRVLRALGSRWLQATIRPDPPPVLASGPPDFQRFATQVRQHLQALGDRAIVIGVSDQPMKRWRRLRDDGREDPKPAKYRRTVAIGVALADSSWLVFRMPLRSPRPPREQPMIIVIVVSALVILAFAIWAAHRVTRPLARFAEAADRLGVDLRAPPLPEHGSRELRKAANAFNRMQDRLRRLVDDRTMMLAAISHDLRTVLTRLTLRAEFIEDAQQRDKAIADIHEMRTMLDASLSFARDDTAEEARTSVDLSSLLQSLCDDLTDAGHKATYDGPVRLPYWSQPVALRRVFSNLIDNALKYGEEANVTAREADGGVLVEISDRGPGIPEDMREQVFAPFFRLESSRSRETGGTGLGMSVARSIVRRHGGDATLHDREGGGLTVRITLPAVSPPT